MYLLLHCLKIWIWYVCITLCVCVCVCVCVRRTWLCSFAVCISLGSALLLPLSILGNEVLLQYPSSRYIQWLNFSLIQGEVYSIHVQECIWGGGGGGGGGERGTVTPLLLFLEKPWPPSNSLVHVIDNLTSLHEISLHSFANVSTHC